ncbi:MAG: radical SAM protein [Thermodesulfobacteriota bacterium]|nr:radical SAM protein [Thermodesulfobacteriota bacterium]
MAQMPDYFIVYNPLTYKLMDLLPGRNLTPLDVVSYLCGKDARRIDAANFIEFIDFQTEKQRMTMVDTLAIEMYSAIYIQNQLARLAPDHQVVFLDGKRRFFSSVMKSRQGRPRAVFMTAMSSNFPAAAAAALVLNHAQIPVVLGGIHVSTTPEDVDTFIRDHAPYPGLVTLVKGAGDTLVMQEIFQDLGRNTLKQEYIGYKLIEDGVWGDFKNIDPIDPLTIGLLNRLPVIKHLPLRNFRINPVAPYTGCPFSCKFCSISTLPKKQRALRMRNPDDFIAELRAFQKDGVDFSNRFFFFTPDNLLLGRKNLLTLLDKIIESDLRINYAVQISIDVANDPALLKKIRQSGGTHFFIGLESLDIRNLRYINKHIVGDIDKSGMSVRDYYGEKIRLIQNHGISIHGSFIFGLPYDYFHSPTDNTGAQVARFCKKHRIGVQPSTLTDLPGSVFFNESQDEGRYLYGKRGTMDYFLSLSIADLGETNKTPPDSLHNSPLVIAAMVYEATRKIGSPMAATRNAVSIFVKSMLHPTKNGAGFRLKQRCLDSVCSALSQTAVSLYKEQGDALVRSSNGVRGIFERLYDWEKNPAVKAQFKPYVTAFTEHVTR